MIFKKALPALLAVLLAVPAIAQPAAETPDITGNVLLSETSSPVTPREAAEIAARLNGGDKAVVIPAALIILAGAKVWSVIVDNRPSADLASAYASAIPGFAFNWNELSSWKKVTRRYRLTIDHWLQGRAVDITYEVSFYHGAITLPDSKYVRKGHYIANFMIKPQDINLKWGWKVALSAAMSHPMNIGTAETPVAMLNADFKWQYAKPLSTTPEIGMNSISVDGLGNMDEQAGSELSISPLRVGETREDVPPPNWD